MTEKLKSAYELAMERLAAEGAEAPQKLTRAQKERIAELRQEAEARRAQLKILRGERIAGTGGEPEKMREEEEKYETDLKRVDSWLESKIAAVKSGAASQEEDDET